MIEKITHGFAEGWKQRRVVFLVYVIQLIIAVPIGIQVYQVMEASIGNSMSLNIIQEGFNRTVVEDFLNVHGASITPLIGTFRYVVPMFLVLSIFLHAGILGNVIKGKHRIADFFKSGVKHFKNFLIFDLLFFLLFILWSIIIWIPFLMWMGNPVEDLSSEKVLVFGIAISGTIYLIGLSLLWILIYNMKLSDVKEKISWRTSVKKGWDLWKKSITSQWGVFVIYALIHLIAILIYMAITDPIGAGSMWLIVFVMLLQQMFSLFRIGLRVALFKSLSLN
ncbi:MAG: hypothetical protein HKN68_17985 [Saprospiraceae bacterium]|nr:hypothetical protein [Saprospiraceae bacterium]